MGSSRREIHPAGQAGPPEEDLVRQGIAFPIGKSRGPPEDAPRGDISSRLLALGCQCRGFAIKENSLFAHNDRF